MTSLLEDIKLRFANGLSRISISSGSEWAERYRIMGKPFPGPYTFRYHPWCRELHNIPNGTVIGMKAAQMGLTEWALNIAFYTNDVLKQDVLYVLPNTKPDAADFSSARFDAALENSEHLRSLYSDVMNVGHKRAGACNMYIRGSGSRAGLKSIPASKIILDEVEEMSQENIPLVFERASGQLEEDILILLISTPMIFEKGIHKYFLDSTQDHFIFRCPSCSRYTELIYPDCLVIKGEDEHDTKINDSHYQCKECKAKLVQETKPEWLAQGKWEPSHTNRIYRGIQIPQLYSSTISPATLAKAHFKALKNPAHEQELWNSKLGLPHEVKGARILDSEIENCIQNYDILPNRPPNLRTTMGVDVGKLLHVVIPGWQVEQGNEDINALAFSKVLYFCTIEHFEMLDVLMQRYQIQHCVIDANPERRKADEFAKRFQGRVSLCFYGNEVKGKTIIQNLEANTITVDRTSWLDTSLSRIRNKRTIFPCSLNSEFKTHLKALVRVYKLDKNGNDIARYEATNEDHYAHAWTYAEMALPLAFNHSINQDITERVN